MIDNLNSTIHEPLPSTKRTFDFVIRKIEWEQLWCSEIFENSSLQRLQFSNIHYILRVSYASSVIS